MAKSETDIRVSIVGSDVIFDFYCQPCDSENLHIEACGYCEQCQEYLCDSCSRSHRKYAALRSHKILDTASMPKAKTIPNVRDILTETCPQHTDKVIEFFCKNHQELCCSLCLNAKHKECKGTTYIPDISECAASSRECEEVVTKFHRLVTMASNEQIQLGLNERDNDTYRTNAIANIKSFRKNVDKELDRDEADAISKVSAIHQINSDKVKSAEQKCQSVLSDAKEITTGLIEKCNARKKNQLYVDIKLAQQRLAAMEKEIKDFADFKISRYMFNQDEKVKDMVASLNAIWSLSVRQDGEDIEARYLKEVPVKTVEDTKNCNISGIVVLTGGRVVVADSFNKAVKLIDTELNKVTSRISMSSKPLDITRTKGSQVAVSLSEEDKIEILMVSDVLSRSGTIDIPGSHFHGISYDGNNFVCASPPTGSVKTVDMSGRVLSTVYAGNGTDTSYVWYIALNPGKNVYYITDNLAKSLTTMTLKGQAISVCRPTEQEFPAGVTVDRDGAIYVCYSNSTIHQLSATGQRVKVLLDRQRQLAPGPCAIAYDEDGDRLFVSSSNKQPKNCNYIRLFQLRVSRPMSTT